VGLLASLRWEAAAKSLLVKPGPWKEDGRVKKKETAVIRGLSTLVKVRSDGIKAGGRGDLTRGGENKKMKMLPGKNSVARPGNLRRRT